LCFVLVLVFGFFGGRVGGLVIAVECRGEGAFGVNMCMYRKQWDEVIMANWWAVWEHQISTLGFVRGRAMLPARYKAASNTPRA